MRREPNAAKDRFLSLVSLRSIIMRQREFYQSHNPQAAWQQLPRFSKYGAGQKPMLQVVPPLDECALPTFKMSSDFCTRGPYFNDVHMVGDEKRLNCEHDDEILGCKKCR